MVYPKPCRHAGMRDFGYYDPGVLAHEANEIAVVDFADGRERTVTHEALDRSIAHLAGGLQAAGLKPGDRVAVATGNRIETVQIVMASFRAGYVPVMVNVFQSALNLAHILADSDSVAVVADTRVAAHLDSVVREAGVPLRWSTEARPGWMPYSSLSLGKHPGRYLSDPSARLSVSVPEDLLSILYTSGSTGKPKGVVLTRAGQRWFQTVEARLNAYRDPTVARRALIGTPLFHKSGMLRVKALLAYGGTLVIMSKFAPGEFLQLIERYQITHSACVPHMLTLILEELTRGRHFDLSSLKYIRVAGAPCAPSLLADARERLRCEILQVYGLTEGGPMPFGPPEQGRAPDGSVGVVMEGVEVKLIASDGREDLQSGELWVRNPGVTPRYLNLAELSRERIVDGWLKTGDIFRVDEQRFWWFLSRADELFVCSGENIYPAEVENVINSHPQVVECCVVPILDRRKGEVPATAVVRRDDAALGEEELKAFYLSRAPAYSHPRIIRFVEALPHLANGKIDRIAVAAAFAEGQGRA